MNPAGLLEQRGSDPKSLLFSAAFHGSLILIALALSSSWWNKKNDSMEFDVITEPQLNEGKPLAMKAITPLAVAPQKVMPPKSRAVFGLSRKVVTDSAGLEMKAGNTVAKKQDALKLNANDADALPIPVDEFLVSKMPRLVGEVRVPYPPDARSRKIEGVVMLELLIDSSGNVRQAAVLNGPGAGLNEAALGAAKQFKFEAAEAGDKKVPVMIRYAYRFIIE